MATVATVADIVARLDRLEAENAALRHEMRRLHTTDAAPGDTSANPTLTVAVSRRQMLRKAGAAAVGLGMVAASAVTLGRPAPVSAADDGYIQIGHDQDATLETKLHNSTSDQDVFRAESSGAGTALSGSSGHGTGVAGVSGAGVGVVGVGHRGGAFVGLKAVINLAPSPHASHPHSGAEGDIVLDRNHRLWLCRGGRHWKQLG